MARHSNLNWILPDSCDAVYAQLAVLMDIRDQLQQLNRLLNCQNFIRIPRVLDEIESNTKKRKYTQRNQRTKGPTT